MHTIPSFDTRASNNGIYHPLVEKLVRDQKSLALISPEDELVSARSGPWGQNGSNYTTRFHYRGNQDEATVHLFGETVGPEDGTALGALGSLNLRPGQTIDDSTTIKDVIALDVPTKATDKLRELYSEQIAALNTIYVKDFGFAGQKRDWLKQDTGGNSHVIFTTFPRKYQIPPVEAPKDRSIKRRKTDEDMDISDAQGKLQQYFEHRPADHRSILLTSSYSPKVLSDFDPEVMRLRSSRLMQQPLFDIKNQLIPPWDAQEAFCKGTLVMAEAQLSINHFPPLPSKGSLGYNTYQIVASKVRVLAKSPIPFHPPVIHRQTGDIFDELSEIIDEADEDLSTPGSAEEVGDALADDVGSSKKRRK